MSSETQVNIQNRLKRIIQDIDRNMDKPLTVVKYLRMHFLNT